MDLSHLSYIGITLVIVMAGLGVPIPEDIPLFTAGYLCHVGRADIVIMLPLTFCAVMVGDLILFTLGRKLGDHILDHRWMRRMFSRQQIENIKRRFLRHGAKIIFAGRFMPGMRGVVFATAGILKVPAWKFLAVDGTAALASVPLLVWLGHRFGKAAEGVLTKIRHGQYLVLAAFVILMIVIGLIEYKWRRPGRSSVVADGGNAAAKPDESKSAPEPADQSKSVSTEKPAVASSRSSS
jgi:membrane protein DedA with SNARE-associated domain